ncbi:MAG: DNRLRE domain-containing protein [Gaiellaceae bacterium]
MAIAIVCVALFVPLPFLAPQLGAGTAEAIEAEWSEVPSKRTATTRTFKNTNGLFKTEAFAGAINFRDEQGAWQPIESELVASTDSGYAFENKANSFKVRFKSELADGFLRFDVAGKPFTLSLEGAARKPGAKNKSRVSYSGGLAGVDLRYDVIAEGVKETLLLSNRNAPAAYRFTLDLPAEAAVRTERLTSGGWAVFMTPYPDPIFVLEAPYAQDAAGVRAPASAAQLAVTSTATQLMLDLTLDPVWIRASGRRFPIALDPTIVIQPPTKAVDFDAPCSEFDPDCLVYVRDRLWVGASDARGSRAAFEFDLSAVPSGANVTSAQLGSFFIGECVYTAASGGACPATAHQIDVHRLTSAWSEGTETTPTTLARNMIHDTDPAKKVSATLPSGAGSQWLYWDVKNVVAGWLAPGGANNGFLLKRATEPLGASGPVLAGRTYVGTNLETTFRPKLEITYVGDDVDLATPSTLHANGAELHWSRYEGPSGAPFQKYEVHRSESASFVPGETTLLATITDIAVTTYRDTTAAPSKSFTYRVVANTTPSTPRTVTLPAPGQAKKTLLPGAAEGIDTYLAFAGGSTHCGNYGASDRLWVGNTATAKYRPTLKFDLRDVPEGSTITNARLSLWRPDAVPAMALNAHRLTAVWDEGSGSGQCVGAGATWYETQPGLAWASEGGDFDPAISYTETHGTNASGDWDFFFLDSLVQKWVSGDAPNFGLLIKRDDESQPAASYSYLSSDDVNAPELRPKLELEYTESSPAQKPTVAITSQTANQLVSGTAVAVDATASDDGRVAKVEFYVDNVLKSTDTSTPYGFSWNSTTSANGDRVLKAVAFDDASQSSEVSVTVKVDNSAAPATAITSPSGRYDTSVLADTPSGYWRLGETTGTIAADSSGSSRPGTYAGSYTAGGVTGLITGDADRAFGALNAATDGKVTITGFNNVTTQLNAAFTVEAGVSYSAFASNNQCNRAVARNWTSTGGWMLGVCRTSTGIQQAQFGVGTTTQLATATVTPGRLHLVGTFDGTTRRLYVNGVQAGTFAAAATPNTSAAVLIAQTLATNMTVDEVAVYNTALSAARVSAHYSASSGVAPSVSGDVTVTASATDNDPITKVEFYVDESRFGEVDTIAPFSTTLSTLALDERTYDGSHTLTTKAYNAAGQVTTSAPATISVANGVGTKYRAEITTTAMPQSVLYDPAAPTQEKSGLDVTVKNTSATAWTAGQMSVRYRWIAPEATTATTVEGGNAAVPALTSGATTAAPVRLLVDPPALPIGVERSQYRLQVDVVDSATSTWFSDKGNKPAENPVIVSKALATALGLERYYHYVGEDLGAGMQQLVNVANGDSIVRWTPFMSPGRGLSTVVDLTYNALEKKCECPAGNSFSLSISSLTRFGLPLDVHPNNADTIGGRSNKYIELTDGDGTTHRFTSSDGITYQEPAGVHLYLRRYSTTDLTRKWALTRPDRVTFYYDAEGYPTSVEDKNGNKISFTLETTPPEDPGGAKKRITAVTDAGGRAFSIDYYSKTEAKKAHIRGRIQTITDHSGSALEFVYYEDGNLLRLTQRGGTKADGSALVDRTFVFTYTTSNGDLPAIPLAADRVDPAPRTSNQSTRLYSVRDPRGAETLFSYLGSGNGNDRWKLASRTDRSGALTSFAYDTTTRVTTVTEPLARISKYGYDSEGKVTKITNPKNEDTLVAWTAARHVTKVTEPTGKFVEFAYNQNGYLTDEWDQLRNRTQLEYQDVAVDAADTAKHISQLAKKTDPKGTATATPADDYQWLFGYDPKGNLTTLTDPEGFASTTAYNPDGTAATATDALSRITTFVSYDANGLPTEIKDAKTQTTRLNYDVDGLLRWIQDPLHAADTGTNEREYKTVFDYDAFHRLGRQSTPKSTQFNRGTVIWSGADYDPNDNVVVQLSPDYGQGGGDKTTIAYDAMDRTTLVTNPDTSVDPAGERTKMEYDEAGRLKRMIMPKGVLTSNPDDFVSQYEYDLLDRVVTSARYSGDGQALKTHLCYDLAGDLLWQISPKANLDNAPAACSGTVPGFTTRISYDDAHRPLTQTDALDHVTAVSYDANGDAETVTDEDGTKTTREYNERGELVKIVEPFQKDAQGTVTRALTSRLEYDAAGNLKREISPRAWDVSTDKQTFSQFVTSYAYDELDRLVKVDLPKATSESQHYMHRAYDANGNVTMVSLPTATADPTTLGATEKTVVDQYDTGWTRTIDEPANPKALFDYTAEGWQSERTPYTRSTPSTLDLTKRILWSHNPDGTLKQVTDRGGHGFTAYTYDANNNVLKADEGRGLAEATSKALDVEASYDLFDRLTKTRRQEKGSANWIYTTYAYDANENVTSREQNGTEQTNGTLVEAGRSQQFSYDGADWLATQTDLGKSSATTDDRLIRNTFTPIGWEKLRKIEARDGSGNFTVAKQTTAWEWFANGDLKTLETKNGAGTVLEQHTVSYEDAGVYLNGNRVKDVFRLLGPNTSAPCRSADCETRYRYDGRERLVEETRVRGSNTANSVFQLDPAGNIQTQTEPGLTQTFDYVGNQIKSLTQAKPGVPDQTQKYWYDSEGYLDCVTTGTVDRSACNTPAGQSVSAQVYADYSYDYLNRLQGVKTFSLASGSSTVDKDSTYEYDALGRTTKQIEKHGPVGSPRATLYQHLGLSGDVSHEEQYNGTSNADPLRTTKDYSYDISGARISMSDSRGGSSNTFTYGYDVQGSVSLLVKDGGTAQAAYGYQAYGEEDVSVTEEENADGSTNSNRTSDPFNAFRYTGKRFDSGSGTIDMGARRFGPDVAHFLQSDTYEDALGDLSLSTDPLTANRYALAGGNPVSFVELDGHVPCLACEYGAASSMSFPSPEAVAEAFEIGCALSLFCSRVVALNAAARGNPLALLSVVPLAQLRRGVRAAHAASVVADSSFDRALANDAAGKLYRIRKDQLRLDTLKSASREARSLPYIPGAGGGDQFDHLRKVLNAQGGLKKEISRINRRITHLKQSPLDKSDVAQIAVLNRIKQRAVRELRRSYKYVPRVVEHGR